MHSLRPSVPLPRSSLSHQKQVVLGKGGRAMTSLKGSGTLSDIEAAGDHWRHQGSSFAAFLSCLTRTW